MGFEYEVVPGIHHLWRIVDNFGDVIDGAIEALSEVEDAVHEAIDEYCQRHETTVALVRGGDLWREYVTTTGQHVSYRWDVTATDFRCGDCHSDTWDEPFTVVDPVWAAAGAPECRLCIGCLENRLTRQLNPADFVNEERADRVRPSSPRLRSRRDPPPPPRPRITYDAPIGSIDLRAFNELGEAFEIESCPCCLPWRAEVVHDPETGEILVREWHAVECEHFQDLIRDDT